MKTRAKIERFLTVLALAPLTQIEQEERERKLNDRLKRRQSKKIARISQE